MKKNTQQRAANLELLRILCMFMIVLVHCIGHGGIANTTTMTEINKQLIAMIQALISVLINCFVLISGYFMSQKQFRIKKVLDTWAVAFFWSVILTVGCMMAGWTAFSGKEIIKACLPFTQQQYWFVTTYLLMYLLVPMLNAVANTLNQRKYATFLVIFFIGFFVLQNVVFWRDFTLMAKSAPLFFCFLYLVAAYVRRFPVKKKHHWFLGYFLLCGSIWLSGAAAKFLPDYLKISFTATSSNRALVILASIFLFMGFLTIEIRGAFWNRLILAISPLTFGVYLIHDHNAVRPILWRALFTAEKLAADALVVPKVLLISVLVFLACLPLEALRRKLFSVCRVSAMCETGERWINAVLNWITIRVFHIETQEENKA